MVTCKIKEKSKIGKNSIRCINVDPLCVGSEGFIRFIDNDEDVSIAESVTAMCMVNNFLVIGTQSGQVQCMNLSDKIFKFVYSHDNKVTCADFCDGTLATGSWDNKCIMYDIVTGAVINTYEHPSFVLSVKVLSNKQIVTGCSDGVVRFYNNVSMQSSHDIFYLPIRGLLIEKVNINEKFYFLYIADNEGKLVKMKNNGRIVKSRELNNIIYSFNWCSEGLVAVGEGGKMFLLNKDLELLETCTSDNCSELWCVASKDNKIYSGGSKGNFFIHEICEESSDDSVLKLDEKDKLDYSLKSNEETKEDANSNNSSIHEIYVELDDKQYKLLYRDNESVHDATQTFLDQNNLPSIYFDQIYEFINVNFKGNNNFKIYDQLHLDKIRGIIGNHEILEYLRDIESVSTKKDLSGTKVSIYSIEKILYSEDSIPNFIKIDICKYLAAKKVPMNWAWLFDCSIIDRKTALGFSLLLTNLIANPPFNLYILEKKLFKSIDNGLISNSNIKEYLFNKEIWMKRIKR